MTTTAHTMRRALHVALDGHAINRAEHRALFNRDPEVNSLAEHILALRDYAVPAHRIRHLLTAVRQVLELNEAEDRSHTDLAGQLDQLTTSLNDAELNNPVHQALGIKALARALRPALADLRNTQDGTTYFQAALTVRDITTRATSDQLHSKSLRHELGAGPHDQLLAFIDATTRPVAA